MTTPALDPAVLDKLRRLNQAGQPDLVGDVLKLFLADAAPRIAAISSAIGARDAATLHREAHTLKGAASNIGATELQAVCDQLESIGAGGSVDGATRFMQELRDAYDRVKQEIDRLLV